MKKLLFLILMLALLNINAQSYKIVTKKQLSEISIKNDTVKSVLLVQVVDTKYRPLVFGDYYDPIVILARLEPKKIYKLYINSFVFFIYYENNEDE